MSMSNPTRKSARRVTNKNLLTVLPDDLLQHIAGALSMYQLPRGTNVSNRNKAAFKMTSRPLHKAITLKKSNGKQRVMKMERFLGFIPLHNYHFNNHNFGSTIEDFLGWPRNSLVVLNNNNDEVLPKSEVMKQVNKRTNDKTLEVYKKKIRQNLNFYKKYHPNEIVIHKLLKQKLLAANKRYLI